MMPHRNALCVVTGGAGFIGCALSAGLADQFERVVAIDSLHPQVHPTATRPGNLDARVHLIVGDVCASSTWDELLATGEPDVVIHLAAETGTAQSLTESSRHAQANVVGTTSMLDAFFRHDKLPRRILLSSSRAVYGEGAWNDTQTGKMFYPGQRTVQQLNDAQWDFYGEPAAMCADRVQPAPVSIYGATKLAQEHILDCWAKATGVELTALRLQNVYGPGQSLTNSYTGIVSLFCQLARSGKVIPLYEDGLVRRDFIFIEDIANAFSAAVNAPNSSLTLDIGSGKATTLFELASLIAAMYGAPPPEVVGKFRLGDVRHAFADSSKANEVLQWQANVSLGAGLARLAGWIDERLQ